MPIKKTTLCAQTLMILYSFDRQHKHSLSCKQYWVILQFLKSATHTSLHIYSFNLIFLRTILLHDEFESDFESFSYIVFH